MPASNFGLPFTYARPSSGGGGFCWILADCVSLAVLGPILCIEFPRIVTNLSDNTAFLEPSSHVVTTVKQDPEPRDEPRDAGILRRCLAIMVRCPDECNITSVLWCVSFSLAVAGGVPRRTQSHQKSKEQRTQHSQRDDSSFFKLQSRRSARPSIPSNYQQIVDENIAFEDDHKSNRSLYTFPTKSQLSTYHENHNCLSSISFDDSHINIICNIRQ
eukprot:scaffold18974_cov132-Skeletonema_marinoi.AAC.11